MIARLHPEVPTHADETASLGHVRNLRVGELVEVRRLREILATLDENRELDSLPSMPEMLQFCGR
jgi:hypothetical protein